MAAESDNFETSLDDELIAAHEHIWSMEDERKQLVSVAELLLEAHKSSEQ